ncbi:hypothetical protein HUJ04_011728 [Dendroctonus ponderosae]|nr:hypothetical protein HUJ04_011728 [Dendroctonus ponderosae]
MFPCLRLRKIAERLQSIEEFERPKVQLEQYVTPAHLGSHMLHTIQAQYGDLRGKLVADLGCGCGALSIGAALLDSYLMVGFEIDEDAIDVLQKNIEDHEVTTTDVVQCDALNIPERFHKQFDTVLMNPPFGTKNNQGTDLRFLEAAVKLSKSSGTVYTLHKTSTRSHVLKHISSLGAKGEDLPATYKFHKKASVDVQVDFYRVLC